MKDTKYKNQQGERQARLIERGSEVFYGARNRGIASWDVSCGKSEEGIIRKVLKSSDRAKNLYEPIRDDVIKYMENIRWWHMANEKDTEVTAHTLSSQVHCLNHLFAIRNDEKIIKKVLKTATGMEFDEILPSLIPGDNLITFEFVYKNIELLNETQETRGAHCTSIDAVVYARKGTEKWLIPIEWKYTEAYDPEKKQFNNFERYINMVSPTSRLKAWDDLYRKDPFYELGRQTLLMEKIIENEPETADNFSHIVVVPTGNKEMRADAERFRESLKVDGRKNFAIIDPMELMESIKDEYAKLCGYLSLRYW